MLFGHWNLALEKVVFRRKPYSFDFVVYKNLRSNVKYSIIMSF